MAIGHVLYDIIKIEFQISKSYEMKKNIRKRATMKKNIRKRATILQGFQPKCRESNFLV